MKINTLLLLITFVVLGFSISRVPTPYCNPKPTFHTAPISPGELETHDMANSISGYNLKITVQSNNSFASITQKFQELDKKNGYLPNIISHHVEHNGNSWGKQSYILYQDGTGGIHFTYGIFKDKNHLPQINETVIVSTDKNVKCFSAALFIQYGLAIVDCLHVKPQQPYPFINHFYYIDLTTRNVTRTARTDIFTEFKEIQKRKIMKFSDAETGYVYLLRAYEAQGVDVDHRDNTYIELFSARNPHELELLRIVDRSFIHAKTLSISDIKVYMNDIYFIDYVNGLYRLDVLKNQHLLVRGRYNKEGFYKFSTYSNNLQNQMIIAVANSHAVYEIDWSNTLDPLLMNKYSLMEHSHVKQIIVNDRYLVVQSVANATDDSDAQFELDYTWIFTKGSRTFSNAYHVVNHKNKNVEIQLDRKHDKLIIADEESMTLYKIGQARLNLQIQTGEKIGTVEKVILHAESTEPHTQQSTKCQVQYKIHLVETSDQSIYPTEFPTTDVYSINYPGETHIDLNRYVLGSNLTYSIKNGDSAVQLPTHWVNKVNETKVHLDHQLGNVRFFHTQVISQIGFENIIYYIQNYDNLIHIIQCRHVWESADVFCRQQIQYQHTAQLSAFTTAFFEDQQGWNYFYILVLKNADHIAKIYDYTRHKMIATVEFHGHYDSVITEVASSNGYLFVLLGHIKTIQVFSLKKCQQTGQCVKQFEINAQTLKPLGVEYFAPQKIVTHMENPQILFIECLGSVILLDIDNAQKMQVLDEIVSTATLHKFYRTAVNAKKLMIVSDPDIIDVYSLEHIYTHGKALYLKSLPTYHYSIQPISDISFSSFEDTLYISAIDPISDVSTILIYRAGFPATTSLYHTIPLDKIYSRPDLQIEVSGFAVDFLNIMTGDSFQLLRVFESPNFVIQNALLNFTFDFHFANKQSTYETSKITVQSVNFPEGFTATEQLNKTLDGLQLQTENTYTWEDRKWFEGHITHYNYSCDECEEGGKVKVREHIDFMRKLDITSYDYHETTKGGVSVYDDIFKFHTNGSVKAVINLPDQSLLQRCQRITSDIHGSYLVTACQQLGTGINLYITTTVSFKAWTWGPYRTDAYNVRKLQINADILMITDTSTYPQFKFEKGRIFLYALAFDYLSGEQFDELEVIQENDLLFAHGYKDDEVYIGNSHLTYSQAHNVYRLYVTEVDNGLFIVDFTYKVGQIELNIIKITFIDLKQLLIENNLHLPTDASFQAVVKLGRLAHPIFDTENIMVTTKGYDNMQITIVYNDKGDVLHTILHRIYYRYAFYNTLNEVKSIPGYVAMTYLLPPIYQYETNYTKQIVAVYDTSQYETQHDKGYSERYMLGAFSWNRTQQCMFAFNTTYDIHSNGTRVGLVVTLPYEASSKNMYQMSLSTNLSAIVQSDAKSQTLTFTPYNDFDSKSFQIPVVGGGQSTILTVIIIILAVGITVGFLAYIFILVKNKKKTVNEKQRVSLLTQEESLRETLVIPAQEKQNQKPQEGYQKEENSGSISDDQGSQQKEQQQEKEAEKPQQQEEKPEEKDNEEEQQEKEVESQNHEEDKEGEEKKEEEEKKQNEE